MVNIIPPALPKDRRRGGEINFKLLLQYAVLVMLSRHTSCVCLVLATWTALAQSHRPVKLEYNPIIQSNPFIIRASTGRIGDRSYNVSLDGNVYVLNWRVGSGQCRKH